MELSQIFSSLAGTAIWSGLVADRSDEWTAEDIERDALRVWGG